MEGDDNVCIPQVNVGAIPIFGHEFKTLDVYNFYNEYAKLADFSIRIGSSRKNPQTNELIRKSYVCFKQSQKDESYQMKLKNLVAHSGERKRENSRCGCDAKLTVVKHQTTSMWAVSHFVEGHNHALSTSSKTHLLHSHRHVSSTKTAFVDQFSQANIPSCQQIRLMEIDAGGPSSLGCNEQDIRNHRRDRQREAIGRDAETLIAHFKLEKRSPSLYYTYETDEGGVFACCFWADAESMSSYVYYVDAVVFDTTYNTNKYSIVFTPLVGVNHHRQTTVFGCGLLSDEKIDSFIWLFLKFVEAMPTQRALGVIITDQDAVIARAVGEVFLNTIHRFCLWHILNKFSEKMSPILYKELYHCLVSIIKQSESPKEFESHWVDV